MRDTAPTYDELLVGDDLPGLEKGPMTSMHIMRWCAAMENWHRIHHDVHFATEHEHLPDIVVNGSWKQHVLAQMLKDWIAPTGWVAGLKFQYRAMDLPGDVITAFGTVTSKVDVGEQGYVTCDIGLRNSRGATSTIGSAIVVLPRDPAGQIDYPYPGLLDTIAKSWKEEPTPAGGDHVTPEVLALIGTEGPVIPAPEPLDRSEVRRCFQATMDHDPLYWDDTAAQGSRYCEIVAPPLLPLYAQRDLPGGSDSLAAAKDNPEFDGVGSILVRQGLPPLNLGLPRLLNGGNDIELFEYARLGDLITSQSRIVNLAERLGKSGPMVLAAVDTTFRAANRDALLLRSRQTHIFR